MTPQEFLSLLWGAKPENHYVLLWTWPDKRSHWFLEVGKAAEVAAIIGQQKDVYVGVGCSKEQCGATRRCKSDEISGLSGIGTDLDLLSPAHQKALPATIPSSASTEQPATGSLEEIGRRDHEVMSEYRIFGPPGTGKTTNLTRQIHRAVDRYGPENILVTSFSRAAAAELAGQDLPIAADRVGTLHSHCWHALGGPEIAEANVEDWNKQ